MELAKEYIPLDEFARRVGTTRAAVDAWTKNKIPILNRRLEPRQLPLGRNGRIVLCVEAGIADELLATASSSRDEIKRYDEVWISIPPFSKLATISEDRVRHYCRFQCPYLGGRVIRSIQEVVRNFPKRGRTSKSYLAVADARAIAATIAKELGDWIEVGEAAKQIGWHVDFVRRCTKRPVAAIGNRPLRSEKRPGRKNNGHIAEKLFVSQSDVHLIRSFAGLPSAPSITIDGEQFVAIREAARLCDVAVPTIEKWRASGCCHLGRALSSRKVPNRSRHGLQGPQPSLFVSLADLNEILANRTKALQAGWLGHGWSPVAVRSRVALADKHVTSITTRGRRRGASPQTMRLWSIEDKLLQAHNSRPTADAVAKEYNRGLTRSEHVSYVEVKNARKARKKLSAQ